LNLLAFFSRQLRTDLATAVEDNRKLRHELANLKQVQHLRGTHMSEGEIRRLVETVINEQCLPGGKLAHRRARDFPYGAEGVPAPAHMLAANGVEMPVTLTNVDLEAEEISHVPLGSRRPYRESTDTLFRQAGERLAQEKAETFELPVHHYLANAPHLAPKGGH